ncbi:MAG: hypothetical protein AAFQ98_13270 [Bacteroidota bacterium]
MMERKYIPKASHDQEPEAGPAGKSLQALYEEGTLFARHSPSGPYYDIHGNFLGTDEYGFQGEIHITTKAAFQKHVQAGRRYASGRALKADPNTRKLRKTPGLPLAVQSKIYTHVLSRFGEINLGRLYKGKVSIRNYKRTYWDKNNKYIVPGYNEPANYDRFGTTPVGNLIKVTAKMDKYLNDLYTVEAIWSLLGIHEYQGHGVKKYSGQKKKGGNHFMAYSDQHAHKATYNRLPEHLRKEIWKRKWKYMMIENYRKFRNDAPWLNKKRK